MAANNRLRLLVYVLYCLATDLEKIRKRCQANKFWITVRSFPRFEDYFQTKLKKQ